MYNVIFSIAFPLTSWMTFIGIKTKIGSPIWSFFLTAGAVLLYQLANARRSGYPEGADWDRLVNYATIISLVIGGTVRQMMFYNNVQLGPLSVIARAISLATVAMVMTILCGQKIWEIAKLYNNTSRVIIVLLCLVYCGAAYWLLN